MNDSFLIDCCILYFFFLRAMYRLLKLSANLNKKSFIISFIVIVVIIIIIIICEETNFWYPKSGHQLMAVQL